MMRRCLQLAACGRQNARPNPMVGAVIVADKLSSLHPSPSTLHTPHYQGIIGEGYHVRCGEGHAEVNAFAAVRPEDEPLLKDATIYVSLEPCAHYGKTPPCCDLIVRKGVRRVVVGCVDPFAKVQGRGIERIREAGIEVTVGVLEQECRWLNRRFFTFHQHHRPYIILKWAQTQDGFLDDHGRAAAISSPFTKMLVHKLRAEEDAIVVGHTTWEREHPQLNVREWSGRGPFRFVLGDGSRETGDGRRESGVGSREPVFVQDIDTLLGACYDRQLQSLIVEGGAATLRNFLERDLWDELRVETNTSLCVGDGTKAPQMPQAVVLYNQENYNGNVIRHYKKIDDNGVLVI